MLALATEPAGAQTRAGAACSDRPARTLCIIHYRVRAANHSRIQLHQPRLRYHWAAEAAPVERRPYFAERWRLRARHWRLEVARARASFDRAIGYVFRGYASQARSVCGCEGCSIGSSNGQYLGGFQMGSSERATYAGGPPVSGYGDALEQTWAAWRYFAASGRDWSPWECKP